MFTTKMIDVSKLRLLDDYYEWKQDDAGFTIIVNGKRYKYEMTLNPAYPDEVCARVIIDRKLYYFNPSDGWV